MSRKLRGILLLIAIVVFVGSASRLIWLYFQYASSDRAYEDIRQEVLLGESSQIDGGGQGLPQVDFDVLAAINPDIIGWIWIQDSPVSYPILKGESNQTYLRRAFDGKSRILGSIFIDFRNAGNFQDLNTIIYGHNTRDGTMFGDLKKYKNAEYAAAHQNIYILTREVTLVYEVFSVYETLASSNTYTLEFASEESYASYLAQVYKQSVVTFGNPPEKEYIITLSTCTTNDKAMRLIVQGKFVDLIPNVLAP